MLFGSGGNDERLRVLEARLLDGMDACICGGRVNQELYAPRCVLEENSCLSLSSYGREGMERGSARFEVQKEGLFTVSSFPTGPPSS